LISSTTLTARLKQPPVAAAIATAAMAGKSFLFCPTASFGALGCEAR
jgi:hypothetical protein